MKKPVGLGERPPHSEPRPLPLPDDGTGKKERQDGFRIRLVVWCGFSTEVEVTPPVAQAFHRSLVGSDGVIRRSEWRLTRSVDGMPTYELREVADMYAKTETA
jgi:hypothetical protein